MITRGVIDETAFGEAASDRSRFLATGVLHRVLSDGGFTGGGNRVVFARSEGYI